MSVSRCHEHCWFEGKSIKYLKFLFEQMSHPNPHGNLGLSLFCPKAAAVHSASQALLPGLVIQNQQAFMLLLSVQGTAFLPRVRPSEAVSPPGSAWGRRLGNVPKHLKATQVAKPLARLIPLGRVPESFQPKTTFKTRKSTGSLHDAVSPE